MSGHCCNHEARFDGVSKAYRRVLWLVIVINGGMFLIEMLAGSLADSRALQADALDFLGDTATYGLSLLVIGQAAVWRARAALIKGSTLALMGLVVLGMTLYQVLILGTPSALAMGGVGMLALAANVVSALLLYRFRDGEANVRSVWLCSRNDAIGNLAVIAAAGAVWWTQTAWPDLLVAAAMAGLFLHSAGSIIRQALRELGAAERRPEHRPARQI
ncbi:MAG: cation transporter [Candidatus Competibacterales bacterium]|nr:cation transporter [Candidatus Competibacterales bacterium]